MEPKTVVNNERQENPKALQVRKVVADIEKALELLEYPTKVCILEQIKWRLIDKSFKEVSK